MEKTYQYDGRSANEFIMENAPPTIRYVRNFITAEEEEYLLAEVDSTPTPKWQQLRDRRVQDWGGVVGKCGLIPDEGIPKWLTELIERLMSVPDIFPAESRPNHVLINDYLPGNGIMEHTDGCAYYPVVATISLGGDLVVDYTRSVDPEKSESFEERYVGSMVLEARSLVILSGEMFSSYLHGIGNRTVDVVTENTFNKDIIGKQVGDTLVRGRRVSLTIRNVPKVRRSLASFLRK